MGDVSLSASSSEMALARLDHLIAEVRNSNDDQTELLLEHLHSARTYLLGAMSNEYEFSLVETRHAVAILTNARLQSTVLQEVGALLDELAVLQPRPQRGAPIVHRDSNSVEYRDKSELYRFFHGSATSLGVFYPKHYIFASFPSLQNAKLAAETLRAAGYEELIAVSASETSRFLSEIRSEAGLFGALMANLSRFFGTEEVFADVALEKAQEGAGFLAIYCPQEENAERIRDLVTAFEPLAMQLYLTSGIQSLIAGESPGPQGNHP